VSAAQVVAEDAQIDNANLSAGSSDSVLDIQQIYAQAAAPGERLANVFNDAFISIGEVSSVSINTITTPKQTEDVLVFIDEGVFLLPSAFTTPERALLMPVLDDPDFPGDQRPEDADDDVQWQIFFEEVVREFLYTRFVLAENAGAEERVAVDEKVASELRVVITYYDRVRENERVRLAAQSVLDEPEAEAGSDSPAEQAEDLPAAPFQQSSIRDATRTLTLGYVGQR
jgi:hypothetical protein